MDLYRDPDTMDPKELRAYLSDIRQELEARMRMSRRMRPARNLWTGPRSMKPWRIWSMKS